MSPLFHSLLLSEKDLDIKERLPRQFLQILKRILYGISRTSRGFRRFDTGYSETQDWLFDHGADATTLSILYRCLDVD